MNGWGQKVRCVPRNQRNQTFLAGYPGILPRFPEKLEENQLCSMFGLAHRNRSDFCDLRLRCPSRTPEIARFPTQEKGGRVGPATSTWSPPGNGSQQGCVFVRCADVLVVFVCMLIVILLVRLVWSLSGFFFLDSERAGEALGHLVSEVLCLLLLLVLLA